MRRNTPPDKRMQSPEEDRAVSLLHRIKTHFETKPFIPHRILTQGDAQTIGAHFWPGRFRARDRTEDEARLFQVEAESKVLARIRWQANRTERPTLVIWHGMEGSSASGYMLITADRAFRAGFNVIRMNFRNCGNTEHLSPKLYHGGLTDDLRVVIGELIARDGLSQIAIAGFSLGGNMVLKLAGEYGDNPPQQLQAVCAISPSIDMRRGSALLMKRRNWIYQRDFLRRLRQRIRIKKELYPDLYDTTHLGNIHNIRQFDNHFVAPAFGFEDADDYYAKASSLPYINRIRIPTMIIHAEDDPFVPFTPLRDSSITSNPYVLLMATKHGGHVGFLSASSGEDRFWAENRLVEFCELVDGFE